MLEENNVVEQPVTEQPQVKPEIEAANFLMTALPMFRRQLDRLTGVQAKRVLSALIETPLEQETPDFSTAQAEDLFKLGVMIQNAKFILFTTSLKDEELTKNIEEQSKQAALAEEQVSN